MDDASVRRRATEPRRRAGRPAGESRVSSSVVSSLSRGFSVHIKLLPMPKLTLPTTSNLESSHLRTRRAPTMRVVVLALALALAGLLALYWTTYHRRTCSSASSHGQWDYSVCLRQSSYREKRAETNPLG